MSKNVLEVRRPAFSVNAMAAIMSGLLDAHDAIVAGVGDDAVLTKLSSATKGVLFIVGANKDGKLGALYEELRKRPFKLPPDDDEIPF
jgi:hypothetical protein